MYIICCVHTAYMYIVNFPHPYNNIIMSIKYVPGCGGSPIVGFKDVGGIMQHPLGFRGHQGCVVHRE